MSDSVAGLAQSIVSSQAAATRGTLQNVALRQQIDSEKAVADLVQQSVETQRGALSEGQGQVVDILA